jgi:hypothetical protein
VGPVTNNLNVVRKEDEWIQVAYDRSKCLDVAITLIFWFLKHLSNCQHGKN